MKGSIGFWRTIKDIPDCLKNILRILLPAYLIYGLHRCRKVPLTGRKRRISPKPKVEVYGEACKNQEFILAYVMWESDNFSCKEKYKNGDF